MFTNIPEGNNGWGNEAFQETYLCATLRKLWNRQVKNLLNLCNMERKNKDCLSTFHEVPKEVKFLYTTVVSGGYQGLS